MHFHAFNEICNGTVQEKSIEQRKLFLLEILLDIGYTMSIILTHIVSLW